MQLDTKLFYVAMINKLWDQQIVKYLFVTKQLHPLNIIFKSGVTTVEPNNLIRIEQNCSYEFYEYLIRETSVRDLGNVNLVVDWITIQFSATHWEPCQTL